MELHPAVADLFNENNKALTKKFVEKYGRNIEFEANSMLGYEEIHINNGSN